MTEFNADLAMANYLKRKEEHKGKQVDNSRLPAGSPMYYHCKFCGCPTQTLPELHSGIPKTVCDPCKVLHEHGCI